MALNCVKCGRCGGHQGDKLSYGLCSCCREKFDKITINRKTTASKIVRKAKKK